MNRLISAQESLWIEIARLFDAPAVLEFKQILNPIFYVDDSMEFSDPNHPLRMFGSHIDTLRNVGRVEGIVTGMEMSSAARLIRYHMFDRTTDANRLLRQVIRALIELPYTDNSDSE
jgi:hypothetical protein